MAVCGVDDSSLTLRYATGYWLLDAALAPSPLANEGRRNTALPMCTCGLSPHPPPQRPSLASLLLLLFDV